MERPYICGGDEYTISGTNTIGLPVTTPNLPSSLQIQENKLLLKSTFHVSLVCINEIIKKQGISDPKFRDNVLEDFCEFIHKNPVKFIKYTGEYMYCEKENLKTVIAMCEVSCLRDFFELLNRKYKLNLEYPPIHVTLYAHDGKTGIFLTDSEDLINFTKSISKPFSESI